MQAAVIHASRRRSRAARFDPRIEDLVILSIAPRYESTNPSSLTNRWLRLNLFPFPAPCLKVKKARKKVNPSKFGSWSGEEEKRRTILVRESLLIVGLL